MTKGYGPRAQSKINLSGETYRAIKLMKIFIAQQLKKH